MHADALGLQNTESCHRHIAFAFFLEGKSMFLVRVTFAIAFSVLANTAAATDWDFLSPSDGQHFEKGVRNIAICISKPESNDSGRKLRLIEPSGNDILVDIPAEAGEFFIGAITNFGSELPIGTYKMELFSTAYSKEKEMTFVIDSDTPPSFTYPTIEYPLTIHLQIVFMAGMLLEMGVIFYLAIKRFARLYRQNNLSLQNLAVQKQKTMNAMVFGIEKERERWSHELHDGLGVKLSLLKQELQILSSYFRQPKMAETKLSSIIDELDTAHQDLRNISHNIMPKSLHKLGLRSAIEELLYRLRMVDNALEVNFFPHADLDNIPRFSQMQMYHIVQELLNNVIKHSHASEINLQLVQHQDQMILSHLNYKFGLR